MKICDNFVTASLSRTSAAQSGDAIRKNVDFGRLNFTAYSILEKKHLYCFSFSRELSAKHIVRSLPLEENNNNNQHCFDSCPLCASRGPIVSLLARYRTTP